MQSSLSALERETQLLVAAGSAVAAGCIPCLETIVGMARTEGLDEKKLKEAVMTGQYVKEQPTNMMKAFADQLVITHLSGRPRAADGGCPLSGGLDDDPQARRDNATATFRTGGCSCK